MEHNCSKIQTVLNVRFALGYSPHREQTGNEEQHPASTPSNPCCLSTGYICHRLGPNYESMKDIPSAYPPSRASEDDPTHWPNPRNTNTGGHEGQVPIFPELFLSHPHWDALSE